MKLNVLRAGAIIAALTASMAFAETDGTGVSATATAPVHQTFNNHLHSKVMISPAQLYQVPAGKTDVSLDFITGDAELKTTADKATDTVTGTALNITGIYTTPNLPIKAGLDFKYLSGTNETKTTLGTEKNDKSTMTIAPTVIYSAMDMVHVAARYVIINNTVESDATGAKTLKSDYGIFNPAVVVAQQGWEAGLNFTNAVNEKGEGETDLDVQVPATITVHGRYAVMPELALGAAIEQKSWSNIDTEAEPLKNQTMFSASAEWDMDALKIEGGLDWAGAYFDTDATRNTDNIATMGLNVAADYMVTPAASVGAGIDYNWGEDKNDTTGDITVSDLGIQVRGNFAF